MGNKTPPPLGSKPPEPDITKCNGYKEELDYYAIHQKQVPLKIIINIILAFYFGFIIGYLICYYL